LPLIIGAYWWLNAPGNTTTSHKFKHLVDSVTALITQLVGTRRQKCLGFVLCETRKNIPHLVP